METNEKAREAIMEVLDNQLKANDPPQTRETFERLLSQGIDEDEVRRLIGCAIATEIYDILKNQKPFNQDRFVSRLATLPDTSWLNGENVQ